MAALFQTVPAAGETSRTGRRCWPWTSSGTWGASSASPAGKFSPGSTSASKAGVPAPPPPPHGTE